MSFPSACLEEIAHSQNHVTGSLTVPDHSFDGLTYLLKICGTRFAASQPPETGISIGQDTGKWLVYLVRDRRRQLTHSGDSANSGEVVLGFPKRFFSLLPLAHLRKNAIVGVDLLRRCHLE